MRVARLAALVVVVVCLPATVRADVPPLPPRPAPKPAPVPAPAPTPVPDPAPVAPAPDPAPVPDHGATPAPAPEAVAPPAPRPAIEHAYLKSLVGTWDLEMDAGGALSKGTSTIRLALDGTALVEDLAGSEGFFGMGVVFVGSDPSKLSEWWFDSMGEGQVWALAGTLTGTGYTLAGDGPHGGMTGTMSATEGGHVYEMWMGGQKAVTVRYGNRREPAAREVVPKEKGPKNAFVAAVLGDWTIEGVTTIESMKMEVRHTGTSTFRLAVGGAYLVQDYDVRSDVERSVGMGVSSFSADGSTITLRWFANAFDGPVSFTGALKGDAFDLTSTATPVGPLRSVWERVDGGHRNVSHVSPPGVGPVVVTETYARTR